VLAYSDVAAWEALHPQGRLGDTQEYRDAVELLGGDYRLSLYLSFPEIIDLVDTTGARDDETWLKIKPYLERLGVLVAGGQEGGRRRALGAGGHRPLRDRCRAGPRSAGRWPTLRGGPGARGPRMD
jgi:hypothetical protein